MESFKVRYGEELGYVVATQNATLGHCPKKFANFDVGICAFLCILSQQMVQATTLWRRRLPQPQRGFPFQNSQSNLRRFNAEHQEFLFWGYPSPKSLGSEVPRGVQGEARVGVPECEAVCRHCLQILTAETIKTWKFCTDNLLILDRYVSWWIEGAKRHLGERA